MWLTTDLMVLSGLILVSNDNLEFREVNDVSAFNDGTTVIELPSHISCRFLRLLITESKQANNVQLNEVEFLMGAVQRFQDLRNSITST